MLNLRPYQREAIDALWSALDSGRYDDVADEPRGPGLVLPTGAGKTVVFAHAAKEWLDRHPGTRVLKISHREELVRQAAEKFLSVAPHLSVGIVQGKSNFAGRDIVAASVQTLTGRGGASRRHMIRDVSLVIVDECHHAAAPTYGEVLRHYAERGAKIFGVTATMVRSDKKALGKVWPEVVYSRTIAEMINDPEGPYLVRPRGIRVKVADLNLDAVKKTGGDYQAGALGEAITHSLAPQAIAKAYRQHAADRQGILFAPTVEAAKACCEALREEGFTSAVVYDGMPREERASALKAFTAGEVQILANCMILTEGTDLPVASCAVIARPTQSLGLFVQMVGRVLRLYPGKADALVLDVTGVSNKHKLTSPIDLFGEESGMKIETEQAKLGDDGEIELFADEPETPVAPAMPGRNGPLEFVEVDLFGESKRVWMRTRGGTWFIAAGDRYLLIARDPDVPGAYAVISALAKEAGSRYVIRNVPTMALAMAWADQDVTPHEETLATRGRRWRKDEPSPAQNSWLTTHGIPFNVGITKGEVADIMTTYAASRRIDPVVAAYYGGAAR